MNEAGVTIPGGIQKSVCITEDGGASMWMDLRNYVITQKNVFMIHDSIYMKTKNRQNSSTIAETETVTFEGRY